MQQYQRRNKSYSTYQLMMSIATPQNRSSRTSRSVAFNIGYMQSTEMSRILLRIKESRYTPTNFPIKDTKTLLTCLSSAIDYQSIDYQRKILNSSTRLKYSGILVFTTRRVNNRTSIS